MLALYVKCPCEIQMWPERERNLILDVENRAELAFSVVGRQGDAVAPLVCLAYLGSNGYDYDSR